MAAKQKPDVYRERIRKLRNSKGLNRAEFSRLCGISSTTIVAIENGVNQRVPGIDIIMAIAKSLKVSVSYLIGESDSLDGKIKMPGIFELAVPLKKGVAHVYLPENHTADDVTRISNVMLALK